MQNISRVSLNFFYSLTLFSSHSKKIFFIYWKAKVDIVETIFSLISKQSRHSRYYNKVDIVILFFQLIASNSNQSNSKTLWKCKKNDRVAEHDQSYPSLYLLKTHSRDSFFTYYQAKVAIVNTVIKAIVEKYFSIYYPNIVDIVEIFFPIISQPK